MIRKNLSTSISKRSLSNKSVLNNKKSLQDLPKRSKESQSLERLRFEVIQQVERMGLRELARLKEEYLD